MGCDFHGNNHNNFTCGNRTWFSILQAMQVDGYYIPDECFYHDAPAYTAEQSLTVADWLDEELAESTPADEHISILGQELFREIVADLAVFLRNSGGFSVT